MSNVGPVPPVRLAQIRLPVRAHPRVFAPELQAEIETRWAAMTAENARLFNGSSFLFEHVEVDADEGSFLAVGVPTDYATFLFWRTHQVELNLKHVFPVGAIATADRKLIVGRMSPHTSNPGKLYPPAGSFDSSDLVTVADGSAILDPDINIARELREEIGIEVTQFSVDDCWLMFPSRPGATALVKVLRSEHTSGDLYPALARHIAGDHDEELDEIQFIEFGSQLPESITMPYVNHLLVYLDTTG